ncbi:SHD1 domain-containing protein [Novipirellula sp. SH528]|uniref:SHD1 domain-containing protein n=1 Tax=Novipirellula sp. SH528 TaxID=3454466 RepID=UPI003F9F729D
MSETLSATTNRPRLIGIATCMLVWVAGLCDADARSAAAQDVAYRPAVGESYQYGIEVRVVDVSGSRGPKSVLNQRCRLRYDVTRSDAAGWTATYHTVPFYGSKPWSESSLQQSIQHRQKILARPLEEDLAMLGSLPPHAVEMHKRIRIRARQTEQDFLTKVDHYSGLFQFCEGQVAVSTDGEVTQLAGPGNMPLLLGQIAKVPLMRLPPAGSTAPSFGYKDTFEFKANFGNDDVRTTEASVLSVISPRKASGEGLVAFDREFEQAGGTTAGIKILLSGSGFGEFSTELAMPYRGNSDFKFEGAPYFSAPGPFSVRVGYHYLDEWRQEFFDNGFLPTDEALSPSALPRLESQQQIAMQRQLVGRKPELDADMKQQAGVSAPPPYDSLLQQTLSKVLVRFAEKEKSDDAEEAKQAREVASPLKSLSTRWETLRHLATLIPRTWSDASGSFKVEAVLVSHNDDRVTLQRKDNGQTITIPLNRLSESDIDFATTFGKPAE